MTKVDVTGLINLCDRMEKLQETIGPHIARIRDELKLTQKIVAHELGITQVHLSRIENKHDKPSPKLVKIMLEWINGRTIEASS